MSTMCMILTAPLELEQLLFQSIPLELAKLAARKRIEHEHLGSDQTDLFVLLQKLLDRGDVELPGGDDGEPELFEPVRSHHPTGGRLPDFRQGLHDLLDLAGGNL